MAFKQPCFIRKNTPELRKELEELGYENRGKVRYYGEPIYIYCEMDIFYTSPCKFKIPDNYIIDCDDNEELFLSLAALRDDTDVNQWFVMDVEEYININQGDWFVATDRTKGKHIGTQIDPMYCHKATIEEIIEHFKK